MTAIVTYETQPALRGVFHAAAAVLLPGILACLVAMGADMRVVPVALVCEFQLVMSALLHLNPDRFPTAWYARVRRLDHTAIFVCGFVLAASYGVVTREVAAVFLVNMWIKLFGSSYWTRWNSLGVVAQYVYVAWLICVQGNDLVRFAIILPYLTAAFAMYVAQWPLRDHPVFGYHEIMHLCSIAVMALMIMKACYAPRAPQLQIA